MLAFFWLLALRLASLKPEPGACEHRPISLMLYKLQKTPNKPWSQNTAITLMYTLESFQYPFHLN